MLRGAGKPVVGHNAFFDLAFILSSFATQLPPSLRAFKELVRAWFPAGFWDTKHLACQLQAAQPAAAPEDTSLGALYADLEARAAGGVASDPGEGGLIQTAPLPTVGHSVTFDRYDVRWERGVGVLFLGGEGCQEGCDMVMMKQLSGDAWQVGPDKFTLHK